MITWHVVREGMLVSAVITMPNGERFSCIPTTYLKARAWAKTVKRLLTYGPDHDPYRR